MQKIGENIMKRKMIILLTITFIVTLVACSPIPFNYNSLDLVDTVVSVELIYYNQPNVHQISDRWGRAYRQHLDFALVEYLETLKEIYYTDFFEELSSIDFYSFIGQDNAPSGIAVLLYFDNDMFDVFSEFYVGRFSAEGEFIQFLGDGLGTNGFVELVERHFTHEFQ